MTWQINFIFFLIVKYYSCYFILLYSSSLTASCHSLDVFSPGISKARWANQLSFAAPCQCFTLAGIWMTVPGGFPAQACLLPDTSLVRLRLPAFARRPLWRGACASYCGNLAQR